MCLIHHTLLCVCLAPIGRHPDCRGKVAIDGRPHEVEGVFDARLDKDDDIFQQARLVHPLHVFSGAIWVGARSPLT